MQFINRELQNSGQKLQSKAEVLIQYRKTQTNIELAVETLTLCLPGIICCQLQLVVVSVLQQSVKFFGSRLFSVVMNLQADFMTILLCW